MKLGIALGGGGAKGFAHIGVLKTLREAGIEFDVVCGTSVGALVGAVYAAGGLDKFEERAASITLKDIPLLMSPAWSKRGIFSGRSALEMLNEFVEFEKIEDLPKKYAAVSVDLRRGVTEVSTSGNLHMAIRASISIPAVFTPVTCGDKVLVDGGILEPVPVEITRALGAELVVAVDLFSRSPLESDSVPEDRTNKALWPGGISSALNYLRSISEKLQLPEWLSGEKDMHRTINIIDVVEGTLAISQRQLTAYRLQECPPDVLIQPAVERVGLLDFHRGGPVIEIGKEAAQAALPEIRRLLGKQ